MKLNGIEEEGHKIFAEIDRNRAFIKKIKEAESNDGQIAEAGLNGEPQKKLKLDTAAAMRMVKPYLNTPKPAEAANASNKPAASVSVTVRMIFTIGEHWC